MIMKGNKSDGTLLYSLLKLREQLIFLMNGPDLSLINNSHEDRQTLDFLVQ